LLYIEINISYWISIYSLDEISSSQSQIMEEEQKGEENDKNTTENISSLVVKAVKD
jgi:hypothetical protein